ncbi:5-methylcytosine restriction system specificity protein McrC [Secundilactobacillus mixtipabuli]|uniref:McrBC 5-methylcytosine restriction system component n=1 Tax=Secundilactobacillus mixtipabuli TaxID=1435342 RepID=A0A1Z5IAS8_9LACO|nr:restriction endonuclease [Secundilactobacillus mixtipabuli]GAW98727.1 McrBC 5-methylcytosine restriction system component [Secundilactobacillus mixtipabuli]
MGKDKHISIVETSTFTDLIYHLPNTILSDRRNPSDYQMAFIELNREAFAYLNIEAFQLREELHLITNGYVGAVPLRMPQKGSGKASTDLIVKPRYGAQETNWFAWMSELSDFSGVNLTPETDSRLKLTRSEGTPTPRYLMAQEVIKNMVAVVKSRDWQMFKNERKQLERPVGNVDWSRYARQSADPQKRLLFPTNVNVMTQNHTEFERALNVLSEAVQIINSRLTPNRIKQNCHEDLAFLQHQIAVSGHVKHESEPFHIQKRESADVQQLKGALNAFIQQQTKREYSWRIDFSMLFERYVQRLLANTVNQVDNNMRISHTLTPHYGHQVSQLMPKYLEPDMVAEFAGYKIVLDAKYKSYFYVRYGEDYESQKERIRHDIHQIIAYTSLINAQIAIIMAPVDGDEVVEEVSTYDQVIIGVLGIPLDYRHVRDYENNIRLFLEKIVEQKITTN